MKKQVIIDCDPGIDDAVAILLAKNRPEIDLIGITTIYGNSTIENTTRNAVYLKRTFDLGSPVYRGAARPLYIEMDDLPTFVHGEAGLGEIEIHGGDYAPDGLNAAAFIVDTIKENPHEISLVCLGRLTNIALALERAPEIAFLTKEVVLMGGYFGSSRIAGNVSPVAEANIYGDPHAADKVCLAGWSPTFVGLDVTSRCLITKEIDDKVAASHSPVCKFLSRIIPFYRSFYRSIGFRNGYPLHDPSALIYLIKPDLFGTISGPTRVVTEGIAMGQTIMDWVGRRKQTTNPWSDIASSSACVDVDVKKLLDFYSEAFLQKV